MSEEQNAGLHPEGSAAWRKLARLREAADHSLHDSPAIADYGRAAREAYMDPEKFAREAEASEPAVKPTAGAAPAAMKSTEPIGWANEEADDAEDDARAAASASHKPKGKH